MKGLFAIALLCILGMVLGTPDYGGHSRRVLSRFNPSHPHGRVQRFHDGFRRHFRKPSRRVFGRQRGSKLFRKVPAVGHKAFISRGFKHPLSSFRAAPRAKHIVEAPLSINLRREFQAPSVQKIVPNFYYKKAEEIPGFSKFTLGDVVYTDI